MEEFESLLPKVKRISPKTIGSELFPFIPGDIENNRIWDDMFKEIGKNIKEEFDKKGIPMPHIVLKTDKISINEINKNMKKQYVKEVDLVKAFKKSLREKEATEKLIEFLEIIVDKNIAKVDFENDEIKEDCRNTAVADLTKGFYNFDPEKGKGTVYYNNFSKRAIVRRWNKLRKAKGLGNQSMEIVFKASNKDVK